MNLIKKSFAAALCLLVLLPAAGAQFAAVHELFKSVTSLNARSHQVLDMDKDGDQDVVIFTTDRKLTLLRNDGTGHFAAPKTVVEGATDPPYLIDFDHDGFPDVLVQLANNMLCWMRISGDGTFNNVVPIANVGVSQVVDVNNDGEMDIFYSIWNAGGNTIDFSWLENEGSGFFINQHLLLSAYQSGSYLDIRSAQMIDMNGDELPDFVYNTLGHLFDFDILHWIAQQPNGSLGGAVFDVSLEYNSFRQFADLDNDGDKDIIDFEVELPFHLQWHENDGTGNFSPPTLLPLLSNSVFVIEDVNGDGALDIMAVTENSDYGWAQNDGAGNFTLQETGLLYQSDWQYADISGDGLGDFVFLHGTSFNDGAGGYGLVQSFSPELGLIDGATVADADGDGVPDIIFRDHSKAEIGWLHNNGTGGFLDKNILKSSFNSGLLFGDFNLDGSLDLAAANFDSLQLMWKGNPNGAYGTPDTFVRDLEQASVYQVRDVDADGDLDWQVSTPFLSANFVNGWMLNDGAGNFSAPIEEPSFWSTRGVADIDGDGLLDLIMVQDTPTATLVWRKNLSGGNFGIPNFISQQYISETQNVDFDQDGDTDLLMGTTLPSNALQSGLYWLENQNNGNTWAAHQITDLNVNSICFGDFNQDDAVDVCIGTKSEAWPDTITVQWYENDGTGSFGQANFIDKRFGIHNLVPSDLDQDGDLDILFSGDTGLGWFENFGKDPLIKGICFLDANENGKQDSTETLLPGLKISLEPAGKSTVSASDGSFQFYATPGDFSLEAEQADCFELTTSPAVFQVQLPLPTTDSLFSFGFKLKNGQVAMSAPIHASATRCGFNVPFWVSLKNDGCQPASAVFALRSNGLVSFVSAEPMPALLQGDSMVWQIAEALQAGETRSIRVLLKVAGTEHLGDTIQLKSFAWVMDTAGNLLQPPATADFASQINCAYDPNDKLVSHSTIPEIYDPVAQTLRYTIRFQNTGTDTAFNVRLIDTLSTDLDWSSFKPIGSSHPNRLFLDQQSGILEFRFDDILLPDSTTNEPGSHGLVSFSIQMKPGLSPGTELLNRAAIFFDFNPPIMTNWAKTSIQRSVAIRPEPGKAWAIVLSPNPNAGFFSVELPETAQPGMNFRIIGLTGQVLRAQQTQTGVTTQRIEAGDLPVGLYFLQVVSEGKVWAVEKFVKQ